MKYGITTNGPIATITRDLQPVACITRLVPPVGIGLTDAEWDDLLTVMKQTRALRKAADDLVSILNPKPVALPVKVEPANTFARRTQNQPLPKGFKPLPKGYTYWGLGPLPILAGGPYPLALKYLSGWVGNYVGVMEMDHYAIATGTKHHDLLFLPLPKAKPTPKRKVVAQKKGGTTPVSKRMLAAMPKGFVLWGKKPLTKPASKVGESWSIAIWSDVTGAWQTGALGTSANGWYAVKKGSAVAKANGIK